MVAVITAGLDAPDVEAEDAQTQVLLVQHSLLHGVELFPLQQKKKKKGNRQASKNVAPGDTMIGWLVSARRFCHLVDVPGEQNDP